VLNYNNSALDGGTTQTIKVVTQQDIDTLVADLRSRAESKVGGTVLGMVASGEQLITQTVTLANVGYVSDHKANQDGDSVDVKLTAEARAYVYKDSDLHDSIVQAVLNWVPKNTPAWAGPTPDLDSVQYAPPAVTSVQDGWLVYATTASARVTFTLTPDLARQIRDLVKGKDLQEARNLITRTYGSYVNTSTIQAQALWFTLDHLPSDPAHISIVLSTPPGVSTGSTAPGGSQSARH
jgi:hypothetical protein